MGKKYIIAFILLYGSLISFSQSWSGYSGYLQTNSSINDMIKFDENLILVGLFDTVNNFTTGGVIKWNGVKFDSLTDNTENNIKCLSVENNAMVMGGSYNDFSLSGVRGIINWDGTNHSPIGSISNLLLMNLSESVGNVVMYDSIVYFSGNFNGFTGSTGVILPGTNEIAMYDPINGWSDMDGGMDNGTVESVNDMIIYNGNLIAGGLFPKAGTGPILHNNIAQWNGSQWSGFKGGLDYNVIEMEVDTMNNFLYVGGGFENADGINTGRLAKWDGYNWSALDGFFEGFVQENALCMYQNELFIGGGALTSGEQLDNHILRWDGENWFELNGGTNEVVHSMCVFQDTLWVAGPFDSVGIGNENLLSYRLAKWHMPANTHCNWLQALIYVNSEATIYQNDTVPFYNNNAHAASWDWIIDGTPTYSNYAPTHTFADTGWHDVEIIVTQDGCIDTALVSVYVEEPVSVQEPEQIEFKIYPNPSSGRITIQLNQNDALRQAQDDILILTVRDLQGKLVLSQTLTSDKTLVNTSKWSQGTYLLELRRANRLIGNQQIIIE